MTTALVDFPPRERLKLAGELIASLPQSDLTLRHYFADGVYGREGDLPAGTVFAGRVHHKSQINIVSRGAVAVLTETGVIEMRAPFTMVSPPGAQRAAYVLEDATWTTLIACDEVDPDVIFSKYTSPSFEEFKAARDEILNIIQG